jgi:hypothetical protein
MRPSTGNTHAQWAASTWTDSETEEYERDRLWGVTKAEWDNYHRRTDAAETTDLGAITSKMPSSTGNTHEHAQWAASSWTGSGTDEYEPAKQSEDGCRDEQIEAWDRERQWAATTAEWNNHRHRTDATETTDPSASARAYSSDTSSTGWSSAGGYRSEGAWRKQRALGWARAGWVDRSEGSRTQDREDMLALSKTSLFSQLDERLTATERELLSLQALVGDLVSKVDTVGRCISTLLPDAENNCSSVPPQPVQLQVAIQGASRPSSSGILTCAHFACNVTHDQVAQLENQFVVNAIRVEDITELNAMISHLQSTVLDQNGELVTAFSKMFTRFISRFKIQYCKAPANRFLLIECRICGCAFYGTYARWYKEEIADFISEFAAFLNVQIQPGATQV